MISPAPAAWPSTEAVRTLRVLSITIARLTVPVVVFGPAATTWFNFLARRVNPANKRYETVARVACDQLAFAPVMIGVFLSSMATMEGGSPKQKLETTWWPALKTNWMVWPFVQVINFTFLPLQHRVLFANVVSIGWNSYLSWVNNQ